MLAVLGVSERLQLELRRPELRAEPSAELAVEDSLLVLLAATSPQSREWSTMW